jgi:hypothetical protein
MIRKYRQIFSLAALLIGLVVSAQAQTAKHYEASIPFDFNVGNKAFSAGDYAFRFTNRLAYQETMTVRNLKNGESHVFLVLRNPANESAEFSRLLFNRYEDRYFLAELTTPSVSAKFIGARSEIRLAQMNAVRRETIALKK